jgi:hypothetical protein
MRFKEADELSRSSQRAVCKGREEVHGRESESGVSLTVLVDDGAVDGDWLGERTAAADGVGRRSASGEEFTVAEEVKEVTILFLLF